MKNGLIHENGELIYYKDGHPYHAGVIEVDGDIYYIGKKGRAAKGHHIVHGEMSNGILKRGTYTFDDDYKLIKDSYKAPKKKNKTKKSSSKSKTSKQKNRIIKICACILAVLTLIVFAVGIALKYVDFGDDIQSDVSDNGIVLPDFGREVLLCTDSAKQLYDNEISVAQAIKGGLPYRGFTFEYDLNGHSGIFTLSEYDDLSNGKAYILPSDKTSVTIDNLKTDKVYYYQIEYDGNLEKGSFKTAKSTRFVYIPGVYNTRDIGGYTNLDGKNVKQGMIIRGTEIDGLVETEYFLKREDVQSVMDTFNFVYDMDLRSNSVFSGNYKSRLGENVEHKFYNSPSYGSIFNESYKASLKNIFSDLAKEENYPMYMHCTYGADRTGTIVFFLQATLNMAQDDMVREYRMTGFTNPQFATSTSMDVIISGLENYNGDTIQEKAIDFLVNDIGITQEEIEAIQNILLED